MNQVDIHNLNDIMNAVVFLFETNITVYFDGKFSITIVFWLFLCLVALKKKCVKRKLFLVNRKSY